MGNGEGENGGAGAEASTPRGFADSAPATQTGPSPIPRGVVPWTGPEIVLVMLLGPVCQSAVYWLLEAGGWFRWFYGPAAMDALAAYREWQAAGGGPRWLPGEALAG